MTPPPDINIISSAKHISLSGHVDLITEDIFSHRNNVEIPGLLSGKAGITLLFAYLSKVFSEKKYLETVFEYLDMLGNSLEKDALAHNMSGGVAGIAFVFQHLRNIGVLDVSDDLDLPELDEFISHGADHDFKFNNWDPLHGMVGLGIYFLERNKETGEKKHLEKIVDHLEAMRTKEGDHFIWITPGFGKYSDDNYNFGMAHGMPGILSFLAQVHQREIRKHKIEGMISSCIPYLLQHEYYDDRLYSFPSSINVQPGVQKDKANSRLAWCYGDLCVANSLIHCGKALENKRFTMKGIDIALKTSRRNFENSGCTDAPFCHGSVGLVHQYNRLYQFTNNEVFKNSAQNWINITLKHFYKAGEGAGGYYYRHFSEEKSIYEFIPQHGLLEGSAGIALVYLSYIYNIKPDWDIIFLTNV